MHPILTNYLDRFTNLSSNQVTNSDTKFYTNYSTEEHYSKLPYLYDIENFCLRLYKAYKENQKICIYSDYDTDAITATGVMYWGLIEFGFQKELISYYAPDRFIEGYGINLEAIKKLSKDNDLIISVDCGINSVTEADFLLSEKCDLIITDHHLLVGEIPKAISVCNPRLSDYYKAEAQGKEINKVLLNQFPEAVKWLNELKKSPKNYMSHSVTGVGVAWFVLVWYKYFLESLDLFQ